MLQFKTWLSEDFQGTHHTGAIGSPNGIDDGSVNIFDISDPKILDLLDTYVGTIGERTYVNPYTPIRALQTKLSTIGLFFSDRVNVVEGSDLNLPLMQFGGRYGRLSDESAEITSDDGITNKLGHGLALQLSFFKEENGRWGISAAIVPVGVDAEIYDEAYVSMAKQTMIGKDTGMPVAQAKSILKFDKTKKEAYGLDVTESKKVGSPKIKPVAGGKFQVYVDGPLGYIPQGNPWATRKQAEDDAKLFSTKNVSGFAAAMKRGIDDRKKRLAQKEDLDEASGLGALQFIDDMASKGVDAKKASAAWNKAASQVGDDEGKIKTAATKILGK